MYHILIFVLQRSQCDLVMFSKLLNSSHSHVLLSLSPHTTLQQELANWYGKSLPGSVPWVTIEHRAGLWDCSGGACRRDRKSESLVCHHTMATCRLPSDLCCTRWRPVAYNAGPWGAVHQQGPSALCGYGYYPSRKPEAGAEIHNACRGD